MNINWFKATWDGMGQTEAAQLQTGGNNSDLYCYIFHNERTATTLLKTIKPCPSNERTIILVCKSVPDLYCYIFHKRWSHVLHESGRLILQSRWMNKKRMSSKLARKCRYMHVLSLFSTFDSHLRSTWLLVFALAMFSSRSVSMDIFSSFRSTISSNWVKSG